MASSANPPMHKCFTFVHGWLIRWQKLIPAIRSFRISYDLIIKLIPARVQELRHAAVGVALLAVVLLFIGLQPKIQAMDFNGFPSPHSSLHRTTSTHMCSFEFPYFMYGTHFQH